MTQTKFLDLDAIAPEMELTIKLAGVVHPFKPTSVEQFFLNTKLVQDYQKANADQESDPVAEFNLTLAMILGSFPTMTREMLSGLNFTQLVALQNWIKQADGTEKVEEEAKAEVAGENPPAASLNSTSDSSSAA